MRELFDFKKITKNEWLIFGGIVAVFVLSFLALNRKTSADGLLHVYFLDASKGSSEFVVTPKGQTILIDAGSGILQKLPKLMPFYRRDIDMIILTKPSPDRLDGLIEVLKNYKVGKILENEIPLPVNDYAEWNSLKKRADVIEAIAGQEISFEDNLKIKILSADKSAGSIDIKKIDDYALVFKIEYAGQSVIVAGDESVGLEQKLISGIETLGSQFVQLGKLGPKKISDDFLRMVNPEFAFLEAGDTASFGARLEKMGIKYYRSDVDGTVELSLDGKNYLIKRVK